MAHKKAGGSTALGRDSQGQRLGVKLPGGAFAKAGAIIIRQRGSKVFAGRNVLRASDDSLFAQAQGTVRFETRTRQNFHGQRKLVKIAHVDTIKNS